MKVYLFVIVGVVALLLEVELTLVTAGAVEAVIVAEEVVALLVAVRTTGFFIVMLCFTSALCPYMSEATTVRLCTPTSSCEGVQANVPEEFTRLLFIELG